MSADRPSVLLCKWQPELAEAILDLPVTPYLVLDGFDRRTSINPDLLAGFARVYNIATFDSIEELTSVISDLFIHNIRIEHVLSHHEFSQLGAAYLERALVSEKDLVQTSGRRDKRLMKTLVRRHGVPTAAFASLTDRTDWAAAASAVEDLGFPIILKPAVGFGTMNTYRVANTEALAHLLQNLSLNPLIRSKHLIVEEFIEGEEVCVDALWHDGENLTFVVHRYLRPKLEVTGSVVTDGSYVLPEAEYPQLHRGLREMQASVNEALGIRRGATHMEVFVQPDGRLVFSEIANRIGGIWIPLMLTEHFGRDVWRMVAQAHIFGEVPLTAPTGSCVGGANVRPSAPGILTRLPTPEELGAIDGVRSWRVECAVGGRAALAHPSEHYVLLALAAPTSAECVEVFDRLAAEVPIEVGQKWPDGLPQ